MCEMEKIYIYRADCGLLAAADTNPTQGKESTVPRRMDSYSEVA